MACLALLAAAGCAPSPADPVVAFCHPDSLRMREALAGLEARLAPEAVEVVWAGGSEDAVRKQLRQLRRRRPRMLVVLGTAALLRVAPVEKRLPVVFALVGDPYFTRAAFDPAHPEVHQENMTGIASPPPVRAALEQGTRLLGSRTWGLLYDPNDGVAVELKDRFLEEAGRLGLKAVDAASLDAAGDRGGLEELRGRGVQVFYLPPAPSARRYASLLLAWGRDGKTVVVSSLPEGDHKGALLRVALDYRALGEEAGVLARRVLRGEKPVGIPILEKTPLRIEVDEALLRRHGGYPVSSEGNRAKRNGEKP